MKLLIGVLALTYACAMGFSRVFLGYHWLTDVLAAALLGLAWAAVVIACHRVWRGLRARKAASVASRMDSAPPAVDD